MDQIQRKGIDVRSAGGYVVALPSVREGGAYEATDGRKSKDLPPSLLTRLLEGADRRERKQRKTSTPEFPGYTEPTTATTRT